jgi:hypothetical protein
LTYSPAVCWREWRTLAADCGGDWIRDPDEWTQDQRSDRLMSLYAPLSVNLVRVRCDASGRRWYRCVQPPEGDAPETIGEAEGECVLTWRASFTANLRRLRDSSEVFQSIGVLPFPEGIGPRHAKGQPW